MTHDDDMRLQMLIESNIRLSEKIEALTDRLNDQAHRLDILQQATWGTLFAVSIGLLASVLLPLLP